MQQMGRLSMHSLTVQCFLYDMEGEVGNEFFVCSLEVPKYVSQDAPNSTIWFAHN